MIHNICSENVNSLLSENNQGPGYFVDELDVTNKRYLTEIVANLFKKTLDLKLYQKRDSFILFCC